MKNKIINFSKMFLIFFSVLVSGCRLNYVVHDTYFVSTNSICDSNLIKGESSYVGYCLVLPASKDISPSDLEFREYASYIKRALESMGYKNVFEHQKPDVVVFLDYGVGEPNEHTKTFSVPIYGQTGISSSTSTSDMYGNYYTTYQPSYGVIGSETESYTYETYSKYIRLVAYSSRDKDENGNFAELWKTYIVNSNRESDLRSEFPNMLGTALSYIGTDTKKWIDLNATDDDEGILIVKGMKLDKK